MRSLEQDIAEAIPLYPRYKQEIEEEKRLRRTQRSASHLYTTQRTEREEPSQGDTNNG